MSQGLMLVLLLLVATGPERGRGLVLDVQNLPEGGLEVVEELRALIGDDSNGDAEDSKPVDPQRASDDSRRFIWEDGEADEFRKRIRDSQNISGGGRTREGAVKVDVDARIGRGRRGEKIRRGGRGKGAPARLLAGGASVNKCLHIGVDFRPPKELANALDGFECAEVAGQLVGMGLTHDTAAEREGKEDSGNVVVKKATPGGQGNTGEAVEQTEGVRVEGKRGRKKRRTSLGKGGNDFLESGIRELAGEDHRGVKGECLRERGEVTVIGGRRRRRRGRRIRRGRRRRGRRRRRRRGRRKRRRRRGRRPRRGGWRRHGVAGMGGVADVDGKGRSLGRRNEGRRRRRRRGRRGGARRSAAAKEVRYGILGAVNMNDRTMVFKQESV
jgi:cytochrome c551/c552